MAILAIVIDDQPALRPSPVADDEFLSSIAIDVANGRVSVERAERIECDACRDVGSFDPRNVRHAGNIRRLSNFDSAADAEDDP